MTPSSGEVLLDDDGIRYVRPDGAVDAVLWSNLRLVAVETNDAGPFIEDVYLYVEGLDVGFYIPQSARGTNELTERFGTLVGFDQRTFLEAMCSTANARFICWQAAARAKRTAGP